MVLGVSRAAGYDGEKDSEACFDTIAGILVGIVFIYRAG